MKNFKRIASTLLVLIFLLSMMITPASAAKSTLTLAKKATTIYVGNKQTLDLSGTVKTATWSSSNKKIATVDNSGTVTAKKAGKATVTAKSGKESAKCVVTVKNPSLSKKSLEVIPGKKTAVKINGQTIKSVTSRNKAVATVTKKGVITAKKVGKTSIIFTDKNNKKYTCKVTVKAGLTKTKLSLGYGKTTTIQLKGATVKSIKSSNKAVATVNKSGKITAKKVGKTTVTFTDKKNKKYTCKVTVHAFLTKTSVTLFVGKTTTIALKGAKVKSMASSNKSVATVTKKGKITAKKVGKAKITVTDTKSKKYTCKVTVKEETFTVKFNSMGGSKVASITVKKGNRVKKPADPVKSGYTFLGWYTDNKDYKNVFDFSTAIVKNISLYARWEAAVEGNATGVDNEVTVYSVSEIKIDSERKKVTARVSAPENCALIVRFVDEDLYFSPTFANSKEYLDDGDTYASHVVAAGSSDAEISAVVNNSLPENFVMEGVLVDQYGNELCNPYSSIANTERYEEFDEKTVYDFSSDNLVLNYDESTDDNFGVLADDVKVLTADDVSSKDEDKDGKDEYYKIKNPSGGISVQDKIFISDNDSEHLFKVASIKIENGYYIVIPIYADDSEYGYNLEDFYKFIKVDMDYDDDTVTKNVQIPNKYAKSNNASSNKKGGINVKSVNHNLSGEISLAVPFTFYTDHFEASGRIGGKIKAELVIEWDIIIFGKDYMRCDLTYSTETAGNVEVKLKTGNAKENSEKLKENQEKLDKDKAKKEITIGKFSFPFGVTGLAAYTDVKLYFEWEISAGVYAEQKSTTKSGFTYNSVSGYQKIDERSNEWKVECKGHAEFKFGPKPSVGIEFLGGVVSAKVECFFGVVAEADAVIPIAGGGDSKHACNLCVEGVVKGSISVDAKLEYKITDHFKGTPIDVNIVKYERKIFDFYLSLLNDANSMFGGHMKAGRGKCPNCVYKTTVYIKDVQGQDTPATATVFKKDNNAQVTTVKGGESVYLAPAKYYATANVGGTDCKKEFTITSAKKDVVLSANAADSSISGGVVDVKTGSAIKDALVSVYENTTLIETLYTDTNGAFSLSLEPGTYTVKVAKDGYIPVGQQVTLSDGDSKTLETFGLVEQNSSSIMGGIYGTINDAVTGKSLSGVSIKISKGWSNGVNDDLQYVAQKTTDNYGNYSLRKQSLFGVDFGLNAGNYTVAISKEGYIPTTFNITIVGGQDMSFNSTITPVGAENVYRIVLTWGAKPYDLDSHLNASYGDGYDHVFYNDKIGKYSYLDVDDTDSYGPETVTINDITVYPNNIMYSVHDYTNRYSSDSTALSNSGAVVKVYRGGELLKDFYVPANRVGNVWNVFYIDSNYNIHAVDTFENNSSPRSISGSMGS